MRTRPNDRKVPPMRLVHQTFGEDLECRGGGSGLGTATSALNAPMLHTLT